MRTWTKPDDTQGSREQLLSDAAKADKMATLSLMLTAQDVIFRGGLDYRNKPFLLDIAQNTANELAQYLIASSIANRVFEGKFPRVVDFCAGTGLFSMHILEAVDVAEIILVDQDEMFLEVCRNRLSACANAKFCLADSVKFSVGGQGADLILLGSAYHHILDSKKLEFLKNIAENLSKGGVVIMNDHFLPPYRSVIEYQQSHVRFYSALIEYLERLGTDERAVNVIRKAGEYGFNLDYEYKVSFEIFHKQATEAGLDVIEKHRVWPLKNEVFNGHNIGSFVLVLKSTVRD